MQAPTRTFGAHRAAAVLITFATLAACTPDRPFDPAALHETRIDEATSAVVGGVFTTTNAADGNAVVAFARAADGSLSPLGTYATGGLGIGGTVDPLQSQFALVLSPDERFLFVVNAGSNDVSVFQVGRSGLTLVDRAPSGGTRPVSVAASAHTLYVLNSTTNDIGILRIAADGSLSPIGTSALSAGAQGAAAIRVSQDGRFLTVAERVSNTLDTYVIAADGTLGAAISNASAGTVPFGFDYTPRGHVVVSEAASRSASSYAHAADGSLTLVTGPVSTEGQVAPCWLIVDPAGRFAYTANAGSASISGFAIAADGSLSLITPGGVTGNLGAGAQPLDLDMSRDGRFLYVFENGTGTIGAFAVNGDGSLKPMPDTPGLAARGGYMGLAAY